MIDSQTALNPLFAFEIKWYFMQLDPETAGAKSLIKCKMTLKV